MSVQLLDKTRKINKLLHNNSSTKVIFNDICEVMVDCLESNILVISKKGKALGISLHGLVVWHYEGGDELISIGYHGHLFEVLVNGQLGFDGLRAMASR